MPQPVIDACQESQLPHEARARDAHTALALNGLDEHRRDPARAPHDVGCEVGSLRLNERLHLAAVRGPLRKLSESLEKLVERVHLMPERVLALFGAWHAARYEEVPQLLQAALFPARGLLRGPRLLDRKRNVGPIERRKPEAGLLAVRDRQASERAAVKRALERHDEAAVAVRRRDDAVQQRGLDRVLHRFGPSVDDEMARGAGGRDAVQLRLETQGENGLIFGVRIA